MPLRCGLQFSAEDAARIIRRLLAISSQCVFLETLISPASMIFLGWSDITVVLLIPKSRGRTLKGSIPRWGLAPANFRRLEWLWSEVTSEISPDGAGL